MKTKLLILLFVLIGISILFILINRPEDQVDQEDTGLTREKTEEMMRKIGYVQ